MIEHNTVLRRGILPSVTVDIGNTVKDACDWANELEANSWTISATGIDIDFGQYAVHTYKGHRLVYIAGRWRSFHPTEYDKHFQEIPA